jgi:DNA end-binding protein Ku
VKITKDMLDLAKHIVEQKSGHFEPGGELTIVYEAALTKLLNKKHRASQLRRLRSKLPAMWLT